MRVKNNKGQTLIEALIALTIIVSIMTLTTVAVITSLNNANVVKSQTQANKLAQEGVEYLRDQIYNNRAFSTYTGYTGTTRCFPTTFDMSQLSTTCTTPNIDAKYRRTVTILANRCDINNNTFTNGIKMTVLVEWRDGKCSGTTLCHNQEVVSCFIDPSQIKTLPASPIGI